MVVLAYEEETQRAPLPAQPTYDFSDRCRLPGFSDNAAIAKDDVPAGTGSGFVWDDAGHIVTNYHVIRGASQAKVGVVDGRGSTKMFGATLVGYNPDKDVAVLKIEPSAALRPGASAANPSQTLAIELQLEGEVS